MGPRPQQPDGGVPSAVESIEHPSEPSGLIGQPTAVTPPTPATCQMWAAAAHVSLVLGKYDPARAKTYRESALRAMEWAERHADVPNAFGHGGATHAAVRLYRLTGDEKWHAAFKAAVGPSGDGGAAGRVYAMMPDDRVDLALRQRFRDASIAAADAKLARTDRWTWNLGPQRYAWGERLGRSDELVLAHRLTGDAKYLRAIVDQAQFALGLNPTNESYTTGLGSRQVTPFNLEARYLGIAYPKGITTYGPAPRNLWRGAAIETTLEKAGLYPAWGAWPWAEGSFGIRSANLNEYTVGNMGNVLTTRGYLAQCFGSLPTR